MRYILSIGTNMGDRRDNLLRAVEAINSVPDTKVLQQSSVYSTEPVGYANQQDFYNICLLADSQLDPHELLGVCLGIEAGFGRVRNIKNGPRILDIDLILAENYSCETCNLILPHPRYHQRRFVLQPMLDIFPDGRAFGIDFGHYIDGIQGQSVVPV